MSTFNLNILNRIKTVEVVDTQTFDGGFLGALLATGDMKAVNAYLSQFLAQPTGVQTAAQGSFNPNQRRR